MQAQQAKEPPLNDRLCEECTDNLTGEEYHLIMKCKKENETREKLMKGVLSISPGFQQLNEMERFTFLMKCNDAVLLMLTQHV